MALNFGSERYEKCPQCRKWLRTKKSTSKQGLENKPLEWRWNSCFSVVSIFSLWPVYESNTRHMSTPISPWSGSADSISPDGRYRAVILEADEVGMGAPTCGKLVVSDNMQGCRMRFSVESCSPSFVWSSDSRALAVPQWTSDRQQRMCIVSVPSGTVHLVAGEFSVLELHSFERGIVRGVDSPIYMPQSFEFSVETLIEHGTIMTEDCQNIPRVIDERWLQPGKLIRMTVILSLLILGTLLFAVLHSDSMPQNQEVFGDIANKWGVPLRTFVAIIVVGVWLPLPFAFWHLNRILLRAASEGERLSKFGVVRAVFTVPGRHADLRGSQSIVILILGGYIVAMFTFAYLADERDLKRKRGELQSPILNP